MSKFAVFVEGFTEQEFTIRLLTELAKNIGIVLEIQKQHQGTLSFVELRTSHINVQHTNPVYVLIVNCCTDTQVKQQIKDNYAWLSNQGYSLIVGLYDIYPLQHHEIQNVMDALPLGLPTGVIPIELHLAILETEAWFLEELTHFSRISKSITTKEIVANGFDYSSYPAYTLTHPAQTLDKIYKSAGFSYTDKKGKKSGKRIRRTVDALSFSELYGNTRHKAPSLDQFIISLENAIVS